MQAGGVAAHPTAAAADDVGKFNVAVLGAAGGIGQPLSLLLKLCAFPTLPRQRARRAAPFSS